MTVRKTITAMTRTTDPKIASQELFSQFQHHDTCFVIFFCSAAYNLNALGQSVLQSFGDTPIVGCTTAGEITPAGYEQHCIVAIGFCGAHFAISASLIESLTKFDLIAAQTTINRLTEACRKEPVAPIKHNTFILTLLDGLSSQEERFLSTLNSAAGGIPHFGGSAGDDINLAKTHVYYQGKFYQHGAIAIMVNTNLPFEVFSTNHIQTPSEKLVVTSADSDSRTVHELNAEPAALEYARLLNIDVNDLSPEVFSLNPLAVKVGGNYFFRSIQKFNKSDNSLTFYCAVDTGIVLTAVELGDVFERLSDELESISARYGKPSIVLACDCILRRLEIEQTGLQDAALTLFRRHNIIGFSTYGEHINGIHLNQTFTGVYIGDDAHE